MQSVHKFAKSKKIKKPAKWPKCTRKNISEHQEAEGEVERESGREEQQKRSKQDTGTRRNIICDGIFSVLILSCSAVSVEAPLFFCFVARAHI